MENIKLNDIKSFPSKAIIQINSVGANYKTGYVFNENQKFSWLKISETSKDSRLIVFWRKGMMIIKRFVLSVLFGGKFYIYKIFKFNLKQFLWKRVILHSNLIFFPGIK